MRILVTGSSGFIGSHLVRKLKAEGNFVVGVDIVAPKYEPPDFFYQYDLRKQHLTNDIFKEWSPFDEVYNLACLMGGMGYIGDTKHSYDIMIGSTQIVNNILDCCVQWKVKKVFYSSSACVYNMNKQEELNSAALKEEDAFPAMPDLVYGWQKLASEIAHIAAYKSHKLDIRVARFHNIFGHEGIYDGGKEKAPAALARKIAQAKDGGSITVWGDGQQQRSFLFIDECLVAVERLMKSEHREAINIGSDEVVSIKQLADMLIEISGKKISIYYDPSMPQGVTSRNSDNTLIEKKLGWRPSAKLYDGLKVMYEWINKQVSNGIVSTTR